MIVCPCSTISGYPTNTFFLNGKNEDNSQMTLLSAFEKYQVGN